MTVTKAAVSEYPLITEFLRPYEKYCVALFSQVQKESPSIFVLKNNFGKISGVFSWWMGSSIQHCIPEISEKNRHEIEKAFAQFFSEYSVNYLFSVIGEQTGTRLIQSVLEQNFDKIPLCSVQNQLLENGTFGSKKNILRQNTQVQFSVCTDEEIPAVFPIQLAYEKEEVNVLNLPINEDSVLANFENYVDAGAVFLGKIKNTCLCKATVTARGEKYVLLGGVYTVPKFRRHGLAKAMINYIWDETEKSGEKITLFVKNDNEAAQKLYASCGFKKICNYEIVYYKNSSTEKIL